MGFAFTAAAKDLAAAYSTEYSTSASRVALLGFELPQSSPPGSGSASPAPLPGGPPPPTPAAFAAVAICLRDERRGESGRRVGKKADVRRERAAAPEEGEKRTDGGWSHTTPSNAV